MTGLTHSALTALVAAGIAASDTPVPRCGTVVPIPGPLVEYWNTHQAGEPR